MTMLSIIVCTYNRGEILKECLEAVIRFYSTSYPMELIVVDNNSTDDSDKIVSELRQANPWIKYVFEEEQGLSHARNTGYKTAIYDWVLYLDDDALIHKSFFERAQYLIEKTDYQCVGGLYLPWYKYGKPPWFRDSFASNLKSYTSLSILKSHEYASGGVLLIKKKLLHEHGGFDAGFGMKGSEVAYGEEDDFQRRMRGIGIQIAYDPSLIIYHLVPEYKMKASWFLKSSYKMGRTFLQTLGYPNNKLTGFLSLIIGVFQCLLRFVICFPRLFKKNYHKENFIIDILKKPLKWFGAFMASWE